jgi:transcriptional regulator with XRE-family HTH domain
MADRAGLYAVPDLPSPGRKGPGREPLWREALGQRLRTLRQEQGEKLTQTAGRAGISPQYLSEVERGLKEPSSEMIAAVAGALGTDLIDLTEQVAGDLRRWRAITVTQPAAARPVAPQRAVAPHRTSSPQACAGLFSLAA